MMKNVCEKGQVSLACSRESGHSEGDGIQPAMKGQSGTKLLRALGHVSGTQMAVTTAISPHSFLWSQRGYDGPGLLVHHGNFLNTGVAVDHSTKVRKKITLIRQLWKH